jgi:peptidoglycan/LPS O-acetylase OafA/YrhL
VTPTTKRSAGLDHLRALAIILVFLYHYRLFGNPPALDALGSFGWTGVDLFFVLSGYLIGGQLLGTIARGKPISYSEFYFKRFLRIIPAYLAVLVLYFTIPAFKERSQLPPLWKFLTFTQNLGLDLSTTGAFSHAWSLCIEEQFYLVLPLIMLALTGPAMRNAAMENAALKNATVNTATTSAKMVKKGIWLIGALFILGFAIRIYNWHHFLEPILQTEDHQGFGPAYYKWIYYPTYTRLDGLLAGVLLAALFHFTPRLRDRLTRHGNVMLLIGLGLITGAWFLCEDLYTFKAAVFGYPLVSIAYGVMVLAALSPSCILYRIPSRITTFIATLSYSLYLTHKQLIHLTHVVLAKAGAMDDNSYLLFWICVGTAFAGGLILHFVIERPFLRLRDKILAKEKLAKEKPAEKNSQPAL